MKALFVLLLSFLFLSKSNAQILKKIGTKIKEDAEWRAQRKAGQKIDQGLDSLIQVPKKIINKKKSKEKKSAPSGEQTQSKQAKGPDNAINAAPPDKGDL